VLSQRIPVARGAGLGSHGRTVLGRSQFGRAVAGANTGKEVFAKRETTGARRPSNDSAAVSTVGVVDPNQLVAVGGREGGRRSRNLVATDQARAQGPGGPT